MVATDINVDARKGDGEERGSDDNTARPFKMDMAHVHARQNEESHRDWGGEEMLRIAAKMTRRSCCGGSRTARSSKSTST